MASRFVNVSARVKQTAAFVAIVWALAASFVAFDLGALGGLGMLLDTRGGRAIALSNTVRNSQTCVAETGATARDDGARMSDAAATAWMLGVMAGMHALTSRWEDNSTTPDQRPQWRVLANERSARAARNVETLAARLQVPQPARFTAHERADANTAFMVAVETDAEGTARGIAGKYSAPACHLYKLGAYWGYASEVRIMLPGERSIFALEIEHHARQAGLPEALWAPALPATSPSATTEELATQTYQLTEAITRHLTNAR
jgi:hypothetical protein